MWKSRICWRVRRNICACVLCQVVGDGHSVLAKGAGEMLAPSLRVTP